MDFGFVGKSQNALAAYDFHPPNPFLELIFIGGELIF
jgi:hypothetical protein